jgi:hypothetical protein
MSSFGLTSLICTVALGIVAYGVETSPDWTWQKLLFFLCLSMTVASLIGNMLSRPSLLWVIVDDIRAKRVQHLRELHPHHFPGDQHG